ncbi:MAG TPA: response regulator, partial [Pyrinomonadaceae bacterium]|nr:response regulator [Pyrinomonadaceae bacterium]
MSKGTLLLADDSITIQKVVNLTFADEGIDVIAVGDGDLAAARLAEITPDIVLADVNMPGLTGYQICEMIRMNEATRDLPVVLLVGSFEPFDEAEANRVGASSYMTKPFQSIRQLVSQVTDLMEARNQPAEIEIPMESSAPAESIATESADMV